MNAVELYKWQRDGYPNYHLGKINLIIHIFAVPLFELSTLILLFGILSFSFLHILNGILGSVVSIAVQGRGHKTEKNPPEPFTSPFNAIGRIYLEQFVTFPRFVFSGAWFRNLKNESK